MSLSNTLVVPRESADGIHHSHGKAPARCGLASAAAALALLGTGAFAYVTMQAQPGSTAPARTARPIPLYDQVLTPGVLAGFSLQADPALVPTAGYWAAVEGTAPTRLETSRLERLGFEAGVSEPLARPPAARAHATSIVEQFRTASGARAELRHQYATLTRPHSRTFPVVGIPGARGVRVSYGHNTTLDVVFTSGSNFYRVGTRTESRETSGVTQTQIAAAADTLYLTVNGCTASNTRPNVSR